MTRVLVVDDHAAWRQHITTVLQDGARWQLVGEAADGVEAVQQARVLQPDLILLDVGLPRCNGIQAAQHVLEADPRARVLFLSEHRSWDIAEAALCTGARGYIVKSDAASELLPALEAIARGSRFVGARLAGRGVDDADPAGWQRENRRHEAAFCAAESAVVEAYACWAAAALEAGDPVVIVAPDLRQEQLRQQLHARGIDAVRAIREGKLRLLGVAQARDQFMRDGRVEEARVWNAATSLIMDAARASTREYRALSYAGRSHRSCGRKGRWRRRSGSSRFGTRSPGHTTSTCSVRDLSRLSQPRSGHPRPPENSGRTLSYSWGVSAACSGAAGVRGEAPAVDPGERGTHA